MISIASCHVRVVQERYTLSVCLSFSELAMAFQAGHRRVPHICSMLPKISCQLTQYVGIGLTSLFILRGYLYHEHLSCPFEIPTIQFESSAIDLTVFCIGVGLLLLCFLSFLSLFHIIVTLGVKRVKYFLLRPRDIQPRVRWHVCVLCLLPFSCTYSVWLFFFVREKWSSSFAKPVQILHLIPTVVFLFHTVAEVLTLICAYALTDCCFNDNKREDVVTHVRVVKSVNYVFILYCISILFNASDDFSASLFLLLLSELLFRLTFIAFANDLECKILVQQVVQDNAPAPMQANEILPVPVDILAVANSEDDQSIIVMKYLVEPMPEHELCGVQRDDRTEHSQIMRLHDNAPAPMQAIEILPVPVPVDILAVANSEDDHQSIIVEKYLVEPTSKYELCEVLRDDRTEHSQLNSDDDQSIIVVRCHP